jgi:hypothetical protein
VLGVNDLADDQVTAHRGVEHDPAPMGHSTGRPERPISANGDELP